MKDKMVTSAVKVERVKAGFTQSYMARMLGISIQSYRNKENGKVRFTDEQRLELTKMFNLTLTDANRILFNGMLPLSE